MCPVKWAVGNTGRTTSRKSSWVCSSVPTGNISLLAVTAVTSCMVMPCAMISTVLTTVIVLCPKRKITAVRSYGCPRWSLMQREVPRSAFITTASGRLSVSRPWALRTAGGICNITVCGKDGWMDVDVIRQGESVSFFRNQCQVGQKTGPIQTPYFSVRCWSHI